MQIYSNFAQTSETEYLAERSKRISSKADVNVIREKEKNVYFFNSVIQVLYSLPVFRDFIKKLRQNAKEVVLKIRKLFSETETSSEPTKTSNSVRKLGLQHYESEIQYDAHECLLQLLAKNYPNINDDCMFKNNNLESKLCNDCGHTTNNDGACIDWSLDLEDSSIVQTISGILHQLMSPRGE